jgi:chromosome segregation ATPase
VRLKRRGGAADGQSAAVSDLDNSFRQRLGSRIERHVMRSAVDMLDERGAELDGVERELQDREADLTERIARAAAQEAEVEHRERRLAELGAGDIQGQPRIDHLIRQLDRAEAALGHVRAEAREELAAADEQARELQNRISRLEETEHRRLLTQADITRREAALGSRERELREHDEKLRRRAHELDARQQGLLAQERRVAERERRVQATETELRTRVLSAERRERELEEREEAVRGQNTGWWNAGPASTY